MDTLPTCISVHSMCAWWLQRPEEEGFRSLGTGVRQLRTAMWVLGTEPDSSRSTACALNHSAASLLSFVYFVYVRQSFTEPEAHWSSYYWLASQLQGLWFLSPCHTQLFPRYLGINLVLEAWTANTLPTDPTS